MCMGESSCNVSHATHSAFQGVLQFGRGPGCHGMSSYLERLYSQVFSASIRVEYLKGPPSRKPVSDSGIFSTIPSCLLSCNFSGTISAKALKGQHAIPFRTIM